MLALVVVAFAALALAQTYPLQITKLETKDLQGNVKTSFKRGEVVIVETTISWAPTYYYYYAAASLSYLEIITMWYGYTMTGLALTRTSIGPGETKTFGGGMQIRMTDPMGTYRIEVYVWNGFPSEVGPKCPKWTPLAEKAITTISVGG